MDKFRTKDFFFIHWWPQQIYTKSKENTNVRQNMRIENLSANKNQQLCQLVVLHLLFTLWRKSWILSSWITRYKFQSSSFKLNDLSDLEFLFQWAFPIMPYAVWHIHRKQRKKEREREIIQNGYFVSLCFTWSCMRIGNVFRWFCCCKRSTCLFVCCCCCFSLILLDTINLLLK